MRWQSPKTLKTPYTIGRSVSYCFQHLFMSRVIFTPTCPTSRNSKKSNKPICLLSPKRLALVGRVEMPLCHSILKGSRNLLDKLKYHTGTFMLQERACLLDKLTWHTALPARKVGLRLLDKPSISCLLRCVY